MSQYKDDIVLASSSPRRLQLLQQLGLRVLVLKPQVDETPRSNEQVRAYVQRLAKEKALVVFGSRSEIPVLAADTAIHIDGQILGKPENHTHAVEILNLLSARKHEVFSGIACASDNGVEVAIVRTEVEFKHLSADEISAYCLSGEPMGKAGAYAIQGLGAILVKSISGSYSNVVGLPLFEVAELLQHAGLELLNSGRYSDC